MRPTSTRTVRYLLLLAAAIAGAWALGRTAGEAAIGGGRGRGVPHAGRSGLAPGEPGGASAGSAAPVDPIDRSPPERPPASGDAQAAGKPGAADAPRAGGPSGEPRAAAVPVDAPATSPIPQPAPPGEAPADDAPAGGQEDEAPRLTARMRRLVRDLEFTAGLPEPPQQTVVAAPAPWRPGASEAEASPPELWELRPGGAPASGGAIVRLRGRNLRPAQVMFGLRAARIVGATGDEVTVVAPAAPSPGPVTVAITNEDGSYALAREPFAYGR